MGSKHIRNVASCITYYTGGHIIHVFWLHNTDYHMSYILCIYISYMYIYIYVSVISPLIKPGIHLVIRVNLAMIAKHDTWSAPGASRAQFPAQLKGTTTSAGPRAAPDTWRQGGASNHHPTGWKNRIWCLYIIWHVCFLSWCFDT